jgi:hypothetical protein
MTIPSSPIEPPFNSLELLHASMRLTLCASDRPGRCCQYHEGYWDALGAVEATMDALIERHDELPAAVHAFLDQRVGNTSSWPQPAVERLREAVGRE